MRLIDADRLLEKVLAMMPHDPCGTEQTPEEVIATDIIADMVNMINGLPAVYRASEYDDIQKLSTAAHLIRVQSEQIGRRPTFRDLLDRIIEGVNSGEFMMSDPVPEGFFEDGHIDVARYIADKYDIRGDADGHDKRTAEYIPEQKG